MTSFDYIKEYNSQRRCRLTDMSKAELIQEYLQMEQRVDSLSARLNRPPRRLDHAQEEDGQTAEQVGAELNIYHLVGEGGFPSWRKKAAPAHPCILSNIFFAILY